MNILASGFWAGVGNALTTFVWPIFLAILILLAMITVHELGHYIAGKILKFKINEFAIGFGPALFKKTNKRNGEIFSIRVFPLGGYCAFAGEDGEEQEASPLEKQGYFNEKAPWKRIIVLLAGATMNYLLALLLIAVSFISFGQMAYKIEGIENNPSYSTEYSLQSGDVILKAEGKTVYLATDLIYALDGKAEGDIVELTVLRDGESQNIEVMLRADCSFENSNQTSKTWRALGVGIVERDGAKYWDISVHSLRLGFFEAVYKTFGYSFKIAGTIFTVLGELLTGSLSIEAVGGPVTTVILTSEIASQGVQNFLEIAAYIGVNLAVFNLLPIPALDGSKVVFCLIEWIFKKPVPRKIEAVIHLVGLILIFSFAILVDILQFV
ncbi:MAG: PDZ domain-containing protein [Clostridiales bacterium]|nr:PDZ domain-containing protein [Clostridiales bacterium]